MATTRALFQFCALAVMLILSSSNVYSKDFYWINNSGSWNDAAHWSLSSGGVTANQIPEENDNVIFDGNSFTTLFPIVQIPSAVQVANFTLGTALNPIFKSDNASVKIKGDFTAAHLFDFQLGGAGYLEFENLANTAKNINTHGVLINSNLKLNGNWALQNHLIVGDINSIEFESGSLVSNKHTIYANTITAKSQFVKMDLTNSYIYGYSELDLASAINIGGSASFRTTDGTFTIGDKNTFNGSSWIKITVMCPNPPFQLDLNITSNYNGQHISCFNACDGQITIVASGTPGPFSYSFQSGVGPFTTQTVYSGLCAGNYTITVKDSSQQIVPGLYAQCSISINVNEPGILVFPPPFVIQPTCPTTCDGQAFTFPSGGTSPLTVFWPNSGETTPNPVGLCTGNNPVLITDANGCFINDVVVINNPPPIVANEIITPSTCNGSCDASILLAPSGGNGGPFTFSWAPVPTTSGQGSNPGIGFCQGAINLSVFDQDGCQANFVINIVDPPVLTISAAVVASTLCNGSCDGQASSNPVGGTGGYTFEWFNNVTGLTTGITDQNPNTLCPGSYYVVVTDMTGCTAQSNVIVINQPPPLSSTVQAYDVSCFGVCDGAVDIDMAGGTPPYFYAWTTVPGGAGAGALDSLSGLCPGQFQIIGSDNNGCTLAPQIVEVFEPTPVTLTINGTNPTCYDLCNGTATAVAGGGVGGFSYNWVPAPGLGQGTPNATSMCDGTYDLTVTDANGCFLTDQVTLTNPPLYDITAVQSNLLCAGNNNGTIDITVNGGANGPAYTFNWVPAPPVGQGTPNVSGLTAGVWTVTIQDGLLCDTTLSFTITNPPALTVTPSVISQVTCNGDCNGSAQVVIGGGTAPYTILWNPGAMNTPVINGLCAGNYTVNVTDANGCMQNGNVNITQPGPFILNTSFTNLQCFGVCSGQATVTMTGGGVPPYTYSWDDPLSQNTPTAFNLCAGTWTVTVMDQNLCDTIIPFTITEPTELIVGTNVINSACFGSCSGSANVTTMGGTPPLSFQWFNAVTNNPIVGATNDTIINLCAGTYYCIVTDNNGCAIQSATITINQLPQITTSILSITDATCGVCDGAAQVSAGGGAGGFVFNWVPAPGAGQGTNSATGICAGLTNVIITDIAGCSVNLAIPINSVALEVLMLDSVDVSCFGACDGQAIATYTVLDPPYTIEWFNNVTGVTTGIIDNPASNPSTATGLCNGDYLAVLTNATGCVTTENIIVNQPPQITATLTPTNVVCNGNCNGTISAVAGGGTGGFSYSWSPMPGGGQGTPNATGLCNGNYTLTVTDMTLCSQNFVATIAEPVLLVINSSTSTNISCFGANDGTANVVASGGIAPLSYEWINCNTGLPIGITTPLATNLAPGTYQAIVTDANGCSVTGPCLPVVEPPSLTANINTDNVDCFGNCDGLIDVIPAGGTAPYFFQWQNEFGVNLPGQTNDTMNNVCQGIYNVVVTDFGGCSITFGPIDMTAPASPWQVTTSSTNITCSGSCDGTATVVVLGGNNPPYTYLWDDPLTQVVPGATNLCAGNWNVTISDAGVCDTTISFTITDSNPVLANAAITNILCNGACTGQITANPTGGVGPYTVVWSDGQLGLTASNLCAGTITMSITDGNGCVKDTTITLTQPSLMFANSSFSNNSACGVCNASATVNILGGIPPYSYDWTPDPTAGEGTNNATGLCPGVANVSILDQNGCQLIVTFPISDINGEVLAVNSTDASCFGVCDGTADVVYVCGDPACSQEWFNATTGLTTGITSTSISNLCADDYFVQVTNNSLCVSVETVTINSPTQIIDNATVTPITCNNDTDGSIVLAPTGGSGMGYTYSWNPIPPNGQGTNSALNIGPGIWDVTITDSDGCSQLYSYTVINPPPITIVPSATNPSCSGFCNGSISVAVGGGYGGYTFQWTSGGVPIPGATGPLVTSLCAGNYNIEVTDINGCVQTIPLGVTLSEPVPVSAPISGTNSLCFGDCSGTATVVPSGGFPPYIVNWYNSMTGALIGQTGNTASNLCTGTYFAVVTDNNGCNFTTLDQVITEPTALTFTLTLNPASCFGFCDGSGDLALAGGTLPYSYEWLDIMGNPIVGGTNQTVINMCQGNYTAEGTDANGCSTGIQFAVIAGFSEITGNVFTNDATCGVPDGNATVFANGGNPPYSYQWMDNLMVPIGGQTSSVLNNVVAGTYFVEVTDANGCTEVFQANISNFSSTTLTFDLLTHPSCNGLADGSIDITAGSVNMPLSFTWNPGGIVAEDPTGLLAGNYTLQITDAMGCINFYNTALIDPAPIAITASSLPSDCGQCNGSISLVTSGGTGAFSTLWNNGLVGNNINGLCSGVYQAQVTDANGCVLIQAVDVANTGGLTGDQTVTAITCAGSCDGQVVIAGVGGTPPYQYLWLHDGSTSDTQTNLCSGNYFATITDATGCSVNVMVNMLDPSAISATETITNPDCMAANGAISVLSDGGNLPHSYLWSNGGNTAAIGGLTAGVYTLTITDASGCSANFIYGLNNANSAVITLSVQNISCYNLCDGNIDTLNLLGGTAPFSFTWMDGAGGLLGINTPLITNLCDGDYLLQATDALGCISFKPATITEPDTILLNPLFLINPTCNGLCNGQIISNPIGGTLPFSFLWNDPGAQTSLSANNLCDGIFDVLITDANGCQVSQSGTLIEPTAITIVVDNITDAACLNSADGAIDISINGGTPGYMVQWISQTLTDTLFTEDIAGLLPMSYYLTITDLNGCIYQDTIDVDTLLTVIANAGLDQFLCFNDPLLFIGTSNILVGMNYTWYDSLGNVLVLDDSLNQPAVLTGITSFIFEVSFSGCTHTDTVNVNMNGQIIVDAGIDIELYPTQTGQIGGSPTTAPSVNVSWAPPIYLSAPDVTNPSVIKPTASTTYYVTATDTNGCSAIDSVFVEVLPAIIIPDGISPNGDGLNETWILDFLAQYPGVEIKINVYNRWGELLFASDQNYANDWGGTTEQGKRLPAGTYYYVIDIEHEDFPEPFTGPITIMW